MTLRTTAFLLLATLFLSACGGSKDRCDKRVWTGEYGLCLADGWEEVPEALLREKGIPEETIGAYHLSEARGGQRDNIVISKEHLSSPIASQEYAAMNVETIKVIPEYALVEKRDIAIDSEKTILHIFTARPIPDLPSRRFYQLSITKNTVGLTFTGTLPFSVERNVEDELIGVLSSVTLIGPEE